MTFSNGFAKASDIKCDVVGSPTGGVTLRNAGPPGNIGSRGDYTYTFEAIPPVPANLTRPQQLAYPNYFTRGRLTSLSDSFNNRHTLDYSRPANLAINGWGPPFLAVGDSSSERKLCFYDNGPNGYLAEVVAPASSADATPAVTTVVNIDEIGHLLGIRVYPGMPYTQQPAYEASYTYDGAYRDQIVSTTVSGVTTRNTYVASPSKDVFGQPIWRLASESFGLSADTSSSDTGTSVLGQVTRTYGTILYPTTFGIDSRTNTVTDPRGNTISFIYHYANPDTATYDDAGEIISSGNDNGLISGLDTVAPAFDGAELGPDGQPTPFRLEQRYAPDMVNPSKVTSRNGAGHAWVTNFDAAKGLPTKVTDPLGNYAGFTWGGANGANLLTMTEPIRAPFPGEVNPPVGLIWSFQYTPQNLLSQVTDPQNRVRQTFTYNPFGQLATATVPAAVNASGLSNTTTLTYDNVTGDLNEITNSGGGSVWLAGVYDTNTDIVLPNTSYDALGDLLAFTVFPDTGVATTSTQPLTTRIRYDAAQAPTTITAPNGTTMNFVLASGVPTGFNFKSPTGSVIAAANWQRDSRGRVHTVSDAVGMLYGLRYDKNGNVTRFLDGRAKQTKIVYGKNNEVTGTVWPDNSSSHIRYDKLGRVRETEDERAKVFRLAYDNANRLTDLTVVNDATQNRSMVYDETGRVISLTAANGDSITYDYDTINTLNPLRDKRLRSITTKQGTHTYTVSYSYFPDGNTKTMSLQVGATGPVYTTSYVYDALGNLKQVINPFNETGDFAYDKASRLTHRSIKTTPGVGEGLLTRYFYGNSRLTGDADLPLVNNRLLHSLTVSGATVADTSIYRSFTGQITKTEGQYVPNTGANTTFLQTFGYDARGRLNSHSNALGVTSTLSAVFGSDLSNNLLGTGWVANDNNQITSAPAQTMLTGVTGTLGYDAAGNLTSAGGMTLNWNVMGDLASVVDSATATTVSYGYDIVGRRAVRLVGGVAVKRYLYDGRLLVAEANAATGQITHLYTWGANGLLSDRVPDANGNPLAKSRFYGFDPLGNLQVLVDGTTGARLWTNSRWTPYGENLSPSGVAPMPFAWKGEFGAFTDPSTGLIRMGVRDYAPVLGRFVSRDPAGFAGGQNLYAYCSGDPVNFYDPDGQMPHVLAMALIGAAVNGAAECFQAYMSGARGMDLVKAFARGALKGAISGAAIGLLGPAAGACTSLGMAMGVGGAEAAIQNIIAQLVNTIGGGQDNFNWKSFFQDSIMGAATAGMGKALSFLCFDGETAVQVPAKATKVAANRNVGVVASATVAIKTVKAGDKVFARDDRTGKTVVAKVKEVFKRTSDHLLVVELASSKNGKVVETLRTTRQHPFYVDGKGWLPAGGLAVGNAIVTRAGPRLFVKSVKWHRRAEGYAVYNFEVEALSGKDSDGKHTHSYFVGKAGGGAWVHNANYRNMAKDAALKYAAALRKTGVVKPLSGDAPAVAAAFVSNKGEPFLGHSGEMVEGADEKVIAAIQGQLDKVPDYLRGAGHGQCAEVNALKKVLNTGYFEGGWMYKVYLDGSDIKACGSCGPMLNGLMINY
ncbi:MAG: hypothetical protein H7145_00025 [Akkermansiaceae bacterium]|nr:hypothetical protein [Armatimonadota bacterium]